VTAGEPSPPSWAHQSRGSLSCFGRAPSPRTIALRTPDASQTPSTTAQCPGRLCVRRAAAVPVSIDPPAFSSHIRGPYARSGHATSASSGLRGCGAAGRRRQAAKSRPLVRKTLLSSKRLSRCLAAPSDRAFSWDVGAAPRLEQNSGRQVPLEGVLQDAPTVGAHSPQCHRLGGELVVRLVR
jgi:hypothetical protein